MKTLDVAVVPTLPIGIRGEVCSSAGLSLTPDAEPVTFWGLVEEWLKQLEGGKSGKRTKKARTLETYRDALKVFKKWLDANGIDEPTRQDVIDWRAALETTKTKRNPNETLSVTTRNLYLTGVRVFYKWLADEYGFDNITAGIEGWSDTKEHKRGFLSLDEMKALLAVVDTVTKQRLKDAEEKSMTICQVWTIALRGKRDKAILATLMAGGLRTIEISRLRIGDLSHDGGACVLNVLGKGRDARETVKISRKAEQVIKEWLDVWESGRVLGKGDPLFCSLANKSYGKPITSASVSRLVKEYLQAAGLKVKEYTRGDAREVKPIVAHSLRGSCATNAFLAGATLEQVKQQLRHRNLATTQIYLEEAEKSKNPVSDLISDGIFGEGN